MQAWVPVSRIRPILTVTSYQRSVAMYCDFCGNDYTEDEEEKCARCGKHMCARCLEKHKCEGGQHK